jgi:predicted dehydrogenase
MLRGAIVGFGSLAVHGHVPGWNARDDVEIVAAADVRAETEEELARRLPGARWYGSVETMLGTEKLDLVDVCTPPSLHAAGVRRALERGLHVLCEKPLVLKPGDIGPLAALAAQRQLALVTVHNWRHAPALAKVTELLGTDAVGQVRRCRWQTLRTGPAPAAGDAGNWRTDPAQAGGGVLFDHGCHALYVINSWLGRPRSLRARLTARRHRALPVEDTASLHLDYGYSSAEIFLTWAADERANCIEIEGSRGMLKLDGGNVSLETAEVPPSDRVWSFPSLAEGSHHPDWFRGVLNGFFEEVRNTAARGRNLEEAALCLQLLWLAQESDRLGEPLPVLDVYP